MGRASIGERRVRTPYIARSFVADVPSTALLVLNISSVEPAGAGDRQSRLGCGVTRGFVVSVGVS